MRYLLILIVALSLTLQACSQDDQDLTPSRLRGLSSDESTGNAALLMETNFQYAKRDLPRLKAILTDTNARYGFNSVVTQGNSTRNDVMNAITSNVAKVGPDGTFFLFMAGHGSPNGYLQTFDGNMINFRHVKQAIVNGRTVPFRRLVIFLFSCYSGNWISGTNPVKAIEDNAYADISIAVKAGPEPYREVVVMTSSNAQQQSFSDQYGTQFGTSIVKAFGVLGRSSTQPTVKDFFDQIVRGVSSSTPEYRAIPETILEEKLFNDAVVQPQPIPQSIPEYAVALGDVQQDQSMTFFVAADSKISSVSICQNTAEACAADPKGIIHLSKSALNIAQRAVFQSPGRLKLKPGLVHIYLYPAGAVTPVVGKINLSAR